MPRARPAASLARGRLVERRHHRVAARRGRHLAEQALGQRVAAEPRQRLRRRRLQARRVRARRVPVGARRGDQIGQRTALAPGQLAAQAV